MDLFLPMSCPQSVPGENCNHQPPPAHPHLTQDQGDGKVLITGDWDKC